MEQRQIDIADMQCRVFNMAQTKWNITPSECADIFKKYDLLGNLIFVYEKIEDISYENKTNMFEAFVTEEK